MCMSILPTTLQYQDMMLVHQAEAGSHSACSGDDSGVLAHTQEARQQFKPDCRSDCWPSMPARQASPFLVQTIANKVLHYKPSTDIVHPRTL